MNITPDQPSVRLGDAEITVSQLVAPSAPEPDRAARAWNVYRSAFRTLQGYQTGGLTTTDLRNAQNQIQAELQAYATGQASQPANVQQAVRALHDIQRQINDTLAAPVSPADQRFSSPDAYTERFGLVRFGQEITQTYLGSQNGTPTWGLLLGDDPTPVFTSPRPITAADFRIGGPVQQALTRAGEARGLTPPDRAARAWNVYQRAFRTLQGYQTGGLTATDLRNAQNQIQAELQAYATGLVSQPDNVQQAVRALHGIQRQINNALAAPGSTADQRFSSPVAYTERFGLVRFGQEITQTYLGSQNGTPTWGLLLGDDPTPVFTSPRPITVADFRAPNGPVQQALTRAGEARSLTEPSTGATQTVAPTAASTRYGEPQLLQGARGGGGAQPATGEQRVVDIDPDGAGPLDATYVGLDRGQNRVQTRVVEVQQYDGRQWATTGFEARGVSVTDLRANRIVSERPGRTYRLEGASTPEEAIERARVMLEHGAISTSSPSDGPPRSVLDRTNDGRFETQSLIVPKGLEGLGNRWVAGFREVLDAQVGADAQRYLKAGNALISLRGTDLQNYVGVALDLAPNVMPVRGAGNQLLYKGEALQAVSTVSDAIRAAGGEAPQVRAVPVYLRVADDKMTKTTIFRVQGRDGRERIVDNVGRTYASLQKWRENNQLGAVDVFLPQGGQLQGRDGKVVLEAFNNRRFDNTALPWLRGGVAILGAGAGVAVMLGTGGVAAPLVMAGGAVFSAVDGAATLADLNWHGQSLAPTARQARAAWLDFGAGLLGGLAIGTGARALARASDLADLLTLGNGVGDLASDWDKLSPGERALAGAQLAFWASMLGASQFSGGRFNLDPLLARGGGGDVGTRGGDAGVNTTRPGGGRSGGTNNADPGERPYRPGEPRPVNRTSPRSQTPPTTPDPKVEFRQQIQQMSEQVFQSGDFRQRLTDRVTPAEVDVIASNQTRLLQLAQDVALETVVERTFSGSGVPPAVQQGFRGRAETWAQLQARVNGDTAAGWLEALVTGPNGSGHRAELLRPLVAEHLGGGNERLQNAVEAQLRPLNESALKNLVALGRDGQPQQATVDLLRQALVARWAEDYRLSAQDQHRLDQAIGQRLEGKNRGEQRTELVNLASSNQTRDALVGQARGTPATARVKPGNDQSGSVGGAVQGVVSRVAEMANDLYPRVDQKLADVQNNIPEAVVNNPATNAVGNAYNTAADWYRGLQRGLQNNPIVLNTLDRYQAAARQARYFPQHFAAKVALDRRLGAADRVVEVYQKADARLEDTQNKIGRLATDLDSAVQRYEAATVRGDTTAQQEALAQSRGILSQLEAGLAEGAQLLGELRGRVETQISAGRATLEQQQTLLAQRQRAYDTAVQQAQGVDTPQVLQARQALAEAKLPFELEQTVRDRRQAYDALLDIPDSDPSAVEGARRAYEQAKTALARHNLAGKDAATDAWIDRDQGLAGQLQTLEVLADRLRQLEGSLGQRVEPGADADGLARRIDDLQRSRELLQRGAGHAGAKRQALEGAQIVVDQQARIDQLYVDARASQSELSVPLGRIGFAHSQAKDIYDGKGKGRIDGLSNRAKIERASRDVAQFETELSQWSTRLDTLDREIATLNAAPHVTPELKTQQIQALQSQRVDAQTQQSRAQDRLDAAQRRLQLEQRAAEPRSIEVRVDDLQAIVDTSRKLLADMWGQYLEKQGVLQERIQALEAELQRTTDPSRREPLQAQLDSMKATSEANDYALARAERIHRHTEVLLGDANLALEQAGQTGAVTVGGAARNVVRGGVVAAAVARVSTLGELATGIKEPDTPEDLLPLLKQMNLPGSEKPLRVEDFKPVAAGVYEVNTVQGPVYMWRTRGTFSDLVVVAQPVPQGRGLLLAPIFNGGTAGRASPSIQKGTDGLYLTLDSQRIALAGVTFGSVFHPDPSNTALNWWETVKVEVGAYGLSTRFNTASTNPQTGAKVPMGEIVGSNSIKAPVRVRLPGNVPLIGNALELLPGVGVAVTVKNSLGVGQLSLVWDPEMGVGQQSDRTSSYAAKFDGRQAIGEWNPGTQPYGFFGTALRLEGNHYGIYDPRNEGHWLMRATEPLKQAFDVATFKWAANPLTELIQNAIDGVRNTVWPPSSGLKPSVAEAYTDAARRWAEEKAQAEGGTVTGHLEVLKLFGSETRAELLRPLVAQELGGGVPVLVNALHAELAGVGEERLLGLLALSPEKVNFVRNVLVDVWARDFGLTADEKKGLAALVDQQLQGQGLQAQYALLVQLAAAPEARRALIEKANQAPPN